MDKQGGSKQTVSKENKYNLFL
jgi:serine/threonine protein kinase